jgi:hypothetical protein
MYFAMSGFVSGPCGYRILFMFFIIFMASVIRLKTQGVQVCTQIAYYLSFYCAKRPLLGGMWTLFDMSGYG